jgi:hypothetical protein
MVFKYFIVKNNKIAGVRLENNGVLYDALYTRKYIKGVFG